MALKGMFLKYKDMIEMWKMSQADAVLWIITFLAVIIIDVDYGLLVGLLVSLILLIIRNQTPRVLRLGHVPGTDVYLDINNYKSVSLIFLPIKWLL